ncbi:Serine/threonine protein kinase [Malassezia vespertilionis]|uniref:non-specific serine/threonine protein kinase n=1 Tax=Malassezia vespertilionis TaxID=2020962 RepID=A0A2N1J9N4_9BASI|nr:Serine/threonine protein kinase [Malassezia vespertilionis]PKI83258.1 hypothetical protein MVES_003054 [Malassezia vespertilionis]WFD07845.1 Serine/threonine protein kinase [Malassezia vespertilionis]
MPSNIQHQNLIGQRIAEGGLEIVTVLGIGAYGVVYLAQDTMRESESGDIRYYAVKCLDRTGLDGRQRGFQHRETLLHTMASAHLNVLTLHRIIDEPTSPYTFVVLDYCADGDLFTMITESKRYHLDTEPYQSDPNYADGRPMPESASYRKARMSTDALIKDVFCQIIDAVEHCHNLGIFHRDLKPENILCTDGGCRVQLADFGLATGKRMSSDFGCGSFFYMGPECQGGVVSRIAEYDTAANDIWSLGIVLINLICGRNPWKQATLVDETFREYLRDPNFIMKILPISRDTNEVLKHILALYPENRYSLCELRKSVLGIKRLLATNVELWQRQRDARIATKAEVAKRRTKHVCPPASSTTRTSLNTRRMRGVTSDPKTHVSAPIPVRNVPTTADPDSAGLSMLVLGSGENILTNPEQTDSVYPNKQYTEAHGSVEGEPQSSVKSKNGSASASVTVPSLVDTASTVSSVQLAETPINATCSRHTQVGAQEAMFKLEFEARMSSAPSSPQEHDPYADRAKNNVLGTLQATAQPIPRVLKRDRWVSPRSSLHSFQTDPLFPPP